MQISVKVKKCPLVCWMLNSCYKTLVGTKVDFNIDEDATAFQLKQLLEEKQGIQVDQIRLIFKGKQL